MYISHTLETPNREQIIHCIAKSIHYALTIHASEKVLIEIEVFDEQLFPLNLKKRNFGKLPLLEEMVMFLKFWFYKQVLSPQVGIMAIHYIDQLIHKTGLLITVVNWRRVLICALMVADKVWEEDVVCNADYCNEAFPLLTVEDLNAMERKFLSLLDFKLVLKTSVYAEYYFALRSISGLDGFPSRPLDKETAQQFHSKSVTAPIPKRRRSLSADLTKNQSKEKPEEKTALSYEQFSQRSIHLDPSDIMTPRSY
jgi:hypothetical protein